MGFGSLTTLNLGSYEVVTELEAPNALTSLEAGRLRWALASLTTLNLGGQQTDRVARLEPGLFNGLDSLTTLNLSDNWLNVLEPGVFDGLDSLTTLNLRDNRFDQALKPGAFEGPQLAHVAHTARPNPYRSGAGKGSLTVVDDQGRSMGCGRTAEKSIWGRGPLTTLEDGRVRRPRPH